MITFQVKNFDRFQHYKDRAPPWIKLYNELLDDYEFGLLPDATKMHLIAIWLLASRSENKIPYDPTWVGRRINASDAVDLKLLADRGFILLDQELQGVEQVASKPQAECLSREREEGEREKSRAEQIAPAIAAQPKPVVEKKSRKGNTTPLPDSYSLSENVSAYGVSKGLTVSEIARDHERFCNHAKQNDRRCVDWIAAEKNWLLGSAEKLGREPVRAPSDQPGGEDQMFEAKFGSEELDAWDTYGRAKTGKSFPRNKSGGWRFPTQWPPGYAPMKAERPPPSPQVQSFPA